MNTDYFSKLVEEIVKRSNRTLIGVFFSSLVPIYIYKDYVPHDYIIIWIIVQFTIIFFRYINTNNLKKYIHNGNTKKLRFHVNILTVIMLFSSILWNIMLMGGAIYAQNGFEFFSFIMTLGLITAAIMSISAIFRIYIIFFLAMIIPQLIFIATFGGNEHIAILLMAIIYIPYIFLFSKETNAHLIQSIKDNIELANNKEFLEQEVNDRVADIIDLTNEIQITQKEVVFTMGAIGESRSKETANHVKRVAEYSKLLALTYGLSKEDAELLKQASPMHDIGKVAIPDTILNKPGKLTPEEKIIMDTHAELGYEMLKHSQRPLLKIASAVAYGHHEKWDGTGYPNAYKRKEINVYARITAVADVFDALGSDRCYKKAWELKDILIFFQEERGKHFEPRLVDILFLHIDKFLAIKKQFADFSTNQEYP